MIRKIKLQLVTNKIHFFKVSGLQFSADHGPIPWLCLLLNPSHPLQSLFSAYCHIVQAPNFCASYVHCKVKNAYFGMHAITQAEIPCLPITLRWCYIFLPVVWLTATWIIFQIQNQQWPWQLLWKQHFKGKNIIQNKGKQTQETHIRVQWKERGGPNVFSY